MPSTTRTLNPDGPPKGEVSVTMTLVLNVNLLVPGQSVTQKWDVDSETGVGATKLRMTVALRRLRRTRSVRHHRRRRPAARDGDLGRRGLTPYRHLITHPDRAGVGQDGWRGPRAVGRSHTARHTLSP